MDNKASKAIFIGLMFICLVPISAFIAVYLHCVLSQIPMVYQIQSMIGILLNNRPVQGLFMTFYLLEVLVGYVLITDRQHYRSDLEIITDKIKTPARSGELQHGSAKWLTKDEQEKAFSTIIVTEEMVTRGGGQIDTKKD